MIHKAEFVTIAGHTYKAQYTQFDISNEEAVLVTNEKDAVVGIINIYHNENHASITRGYDEDVSEIAYDVFAGMGIDQLACTIINTYAT